MSRSPKPFRVSPEIINSPPYEFTQRLCESCGYSIQQARSYVATRRDWTGVRTPGFNSMPRKLLPQNNHTVTIRKAWSEDAFDSRVYAFPPALKGTGLIQRGKTNDFWPWEQFPTATFIPSARVKALNKLMSKVGSSGGLAVDLGEYRQTTSMIATNCRRLAGAALALKHGNVGLCLTNLGWTPKGKHFPSAPKETDPFKRLSNHWLEYVYGWKPLVQDIHESVSSLETFLEANPWVLTVGASGKAQDMVIKKMPITAGSPGQPAGPGGSITPLHCGVESHLTMAVCRFKLAYRRDDHVKRLIADLGLNNPADLVWELLPWSFVVDWFYPIGPWLESLHAWDGLIFHHGTESHLTSEDSNQAIGASYTFGDGFGYGNVNQHGQRSDLVINYVRTPLIGFPASHWPELKSPISVQHAANALALLVGVFRR